MSGSNRRSKNDCSTLHGAHGHVAGRAEDVSPTGIGVRVRQTEGIEVGQMVLVHRMHEQRISMGTVRYLGAQDENGYRIGIELHPESDVSQLPLPKSD